MPLGYEKGKHNLSYGLFMAIEGRPQTMKELRQKTGYSTAQLRIHLNRLRDAGLVVMRKDNKWQSLVILLPVQEKAAQKAGIVPEKQAPRVADIKIDPEEEKVPPTAAAQAKRLNLPAKIGARLLSVSKVRKLCKCGKSTPIFYGLEPTCPKCARESA
jgi:DNA-binding MarR family transcriptional regulator